MAVDRSCAWSMKRRCWGLGVSIPPFTFVLYCPCHLPIPLLLVTSSLLSFPPSLFTLPRCSFHLLPPFVGSKTFIPQAVHSWARRGSCALGARSSARAVPDAVCNVQRSSCLQPSHSSMQRSTPQPCNLPAFNLLSMSALAKHIQQHNADNDQHNTGHTGDIQLFAPDQHADDRNGGCSQS